MSLAEEYENLLRANQSYLNRARRDARESFDLAARGQNFSRLGSSGTLQGADMARRAIGNVEAGGAISVVDMILTAVAKTQGQVQKDLAAFGRELAKTTGKRDGMAEAHKRVAASAQAAVVSSYYARVGKDTPARREDRLKGQMLRALNERNFITTSKDEIGFGNVAMLYKVAPHWRRLNFGAGGLGEKKRPQAFGFNFKTGGRGETLQLPHNPGPAFRIPPGLFFDGANLTNPLPFNPARARHAGGPGDNFYPNSIIRGRSMVKVSGSGKRKFVASKRQDNFYTRGIQGAHFMDAGLRRIAKDLPTEYLKLAKEWQKKAKKSGGGTISTRAR